MNEAWRFRRWFGPGILLAVLLAAAVALLREPRAWGLALTTIRVVALTVLIALPTGTALAILLSRTDLPLRRVFVAAWCLLPARARGVFREAVGAGAAEWARGRGWALSIAVIALPYYWDTNPPVAENSRHVIREILAEPA